MKSSCPMLRTSALVLALALVANLSLAIPATAAPASTGGETAGLTHSSLAGFWSELVELLGPTAPSSSDDGSTEEDGSTEDEDCDTDNSCDLDPGGIGGIMDPNG